MRNSEATVVRGARPEDAEAMRAIYAPYVLRTAVSFEYDVPTAAEFRARVEKTLGTHPWLLAEEAGEVLGYSYAGVFKPRAAYGRCVGTSVYVREDSRGRGLGRMLYEALEARLKARGILNLNACITWTDEPDAYLTHASPRFHARLGFAKAAHFHRCGWKFGRRYDMIRMEKLLPEPSLSD